MLRALGHYRWFARAMGVLVPLDRVVGTVTKGRIIALGLVPMLIITTTGRKSGLARTQPLLYVRDGEQFAVIGSNWGQPSHPAWSGNLLTNPDAIVTLKGERIPVRAELVEGADRERIWRLAVEQWPAYDTYAARAGRPIRVFRLVRRELTG